MTDGLTEFGIADEGTTPFPREESGDVLDQAAEVTERYDLLGQSMEVVRDLILRGNPDLVAEMVRGETLSELLESVEPAREAYRVLAERVRAVAPVVPAGGVGVEVIEGPGDVLIKRAIVRRRGGAEARSRGDEETKRRKDEGTRRGGA